MTTITDPLVECAGGCGRRIDRRMAYWVAPLDDEQRELYDEVPLCEPCWDWVHENDTDAQ